MKRFAKVYIEISNICNLKCSFCPGTTRKPKRMSIDEFKIVLEKIKDYDADAKVIMVTAAGQKNKMLEAIKLGAAEFVTKPFETSQIISILESIK